MNRSARGIDETGAYARKQLFSSNRLLTWSHGARFDLGVRLARKYGATRLLDYGAGDGTFLVLVHDQISEGVGAEVDARLVEDCRARYAHIKNLAFVHTEALATYPDASFDTIVCMEVLEHCTAPAVEQVLQDIQRLLSARGVAIISVPIETGPPLVLKQLARAILARTLRGDYAQREKYSAGELVRMLAPGATSPIERPVYRAGNDAAALPYHGHKGFNWRALRSRLSSELEIIDQLYSPVGVHPWLNSQAWLVCRKRVRT